MEIILVIIVSAMLAYMLYYKTLQWHYTKKSNLATFVVRLKSGVKYYLHLSDKITRDELAEIVNYIEGKEEEIIGIYNIFGEELEYVKGRWLEK